MLELILKIVTFFCLLLIFLQDFKERAVYVSVFIIAGISMALLFFVNSHQNQAYLSNILINVAVVFVIIFILGTYSKIKLQQSLKDGIGKGDVFFFLIIALSFPVTSFIILFSSSLLFSLMLFLFLKPKLISKSVPLAGLQSLFFLLIYSINWSFQIINLYAL